MLGRIAHRPLGGHPFFFGLLLIVAVAAIVGLVVYLVVRRPRSSGAAPSASAPPQPAGFDPAVEAARLRYAQGQLSREAYVQIVGDLTGRPLTTIDTGPPPQTSPQG